MNPLEILLEAGLIKILSSVEIFNIKWSRSEYWSHFMSNDSNAVFTSNNSSAVGFNNERH